MVPRAVKKVEIVIRLKVAKSLSGSIFLKPKNFLFLLHDSRNCKHNDCGFGVSGRTPWPRLSGLPKVVRYGEEKEGKGGNSEAWGNSGWGKKGKWGDKGGKWGDKGKGWGKGHGKGWGKQPQGYWSEKGMWIDSHDESDKMVIRLG